MTPYTAPTVVAHGIVNGSGADWSTTPCRTSGVTSSATASSTSATTIRRHGHHRRVRRVELDRQWHDAAGELTAALAVDQPKYVAAVRTELLVRIDAPLTRR